uniref:Uncharacterized protein n=1 Tax=Avena sativa TaxID=4498 RepID=A0ACD5XV73_AVESA
MHEALRSASHRPAYDPRICSAVLRSAKFHFGGADLAEEAKKFLAGRYKKFPSTELQDELMKIPLAVIVAILSRSDLGAASEEGIYDSVLRWADLQYPNSEERRQILGSHLLPLVTLMRGLNNVPIVPQPKCRINFALHRGHCSKLFPSGSKYRQKFSFARHVYSLSAHRNMDSSNRFGLLLLMLDDKGPVEGTIDYKFEVQTRPLLQYVTKYEWTSTDSREAAVCKDLFGVPWSEFIADGSPFFIDDILHLQVRLNTTQKPL